jgi:hypothetical protein
VGKGRQISAIILNHFCRGKTKVGEGLWVGMGDVGHPVSLQRAAGVQRLTNDMHGAYQELMAGPSSTVSAKVCPCHALTCPAPPPSQAVWMSVSGDLVHATTFC